MSVIKLVLIFISFVFAGSVSAISEAYCVDTTYTTYQTYGKLKKKYPEIKIVESKNNIQLKTDENVIYKTVDDRDLHLDIYRPIKQNKYPAVIMIHGGGWRSGNKTMERPMAQQIALQRFVAVPVEYRLSLEARYPAAIHDIKAAIRFLKDNADKFSIDTTKIAIEGESAGGQLAMLVAMTNNNVIFEGDKSGRKSSSTVHAAIDVDGVVDFLAPNSLNIARKPDSPDAYWIGGIFDEKPLIWKEASPIYWVNGKSVPTLFIASSVPRYHAGRDEMIDLLSQNGVYSESYTIPGAPHSFWLFEPWFESTKNYMLKFLNKVFLK